MLESRMRASSRPRARPPLKPKKVKIRVLRAAWVMIFGNWSKKISGSKKAFWSLPQSAFRIDDEEHQQRDAVDGVAHGARFGSSVHGSFPGRVVDRLLHRWGRTLRRGLHRCSTHVGRVDQLLAPNHFS